MRGRSHSIANQLVGSEEGPTVQRVGGVGIDAGSKPRQEQADKQQHSGGAATVHHGAERPSLAVCRRMQPKLLSFAIALPQVER